MSKGYQKTFAVRRARLSDLSELTDLYLGLSETSRRLFHPFPFKRSQVKIIFSIMILSGGMFGALKKTVPGIGFLLLVAEDLASKRIDGFTYFSTRSKLVRGTLIANRGIVVREGIRSKGVGTALDKELINMAKIMGIKRFSVTALKENTQSLSLHRKMGYQIRGSTTDFWNDEIIDTFILELELGSH